MIAFRRGKPPERIGGPLRIDVAQGDDILAADRLDIAFPLAAHADPGDVQLVVGSRLLRTAEDVARYDREQRGAGRRPVQELPPVERVWIAWHAFSPWGMSGVRIRGIRAVYEAGFPKTSTST